MRIHGNDCYEADFVARRFPDLAPQKVYGMTALVANDGSVAGMCTISQ